MMRFLRYFLLLLITTPVLAQSCNLPFTDTFAGSSGTPISSCWAQTTPSTQGLVVNGSNGAVLANPSTDNSYEMMTGANLISGTIKGTLTWSGTNPTGNVKMMLAGDTSGNFFIYDIVNGNVTVWSGGSFASTFMFGCPQPPAGGTSQPILSGDVISLTMTPGTPPAQTWTCKDETTGASATQVTPFPPYANGFGGISILQSNAVWSDIHITGTPVPVSVTTTTLCSGEVGTAYSCSASATGGTGRFNWTLTGTALPSPLILDPTTCTNSTVPCQITGTPTTTSTTTGIILTATDMASATASSPAMSIRIYPTPPPPGPGIPQLLCVESVANGTTTSCDTHGSTMNIVVVQADAACDPQVPAPFTDSEGNVYTRVSCSPAPGATGTSLWVSPNPHTSINTSWATTSIIVPTAWAYIASGPDQTTSSLDGTDTGFITPTENNELAFSYAAAQRPVAPPTSSPAALLASATDGFITEVGAWQNQVTAAPINNSFSWGGGTNGQVQAISSFFSTMNPGPLTIAPHVVEEVAGASCLSTIAAAGGLTPYFFTLDSSSVALPTGVTLNTDGTFTCSGTTAGVTTGLVFKVTDSQSTPAHTTSSAVTLPIAATALTVAFSGATSGTQLQAYSGGTATVTGGYPSYVITNTQLPAGLSITCSGSTCPVTSSTIRDEGVFNTVLTATDIYGATASTTVTFSINGDNSFNGNLLFPADSIWRLKLRGLPLVQGGFAGIFTPYAASSLRIGFGADCQCGIPINTVAFGTTPTIPDAASQMFTQTVVPCNAAIEGGPILNPSDFDGSVDHHNISIIMNSSGVPDYEIDGYQTYCQNNTDGWQVPPMNGGTNVSFSPQPPSPANINSYLMIQPDLGDVADAAGEPMAATILKFDDVKGTCSGDFIRDGMGNIIDVDACGTVHYPIRFTLARTLAYALPPATGAAGQSRNSCTGGGTDNVNAFMTFLSPPVTCTNLGTPITVATAAPGTFLNPLGETFGLPASFAEPTACKPPSLGGTGNNETHIIFLAMTEQNGVGIFNSDAGNSMSIIGTNDARWLPDSLIAPCFGAIHGTDFVAYVTESALVTPWNGNIQNSTQVVGGSSTPFNIKLSGNLRLDGPVVLQ